MPKRPISHQLEEESRIAFESLLGTWVYRRKTPDYGIDGEVELFDENRKASGLQFLVQLKATQRTRQQCGISLGIEWIKYYQSLELPVLIVLWIKQSGKAFWRWASDIDLYYARPKAKSHTVRLVHQWDSETRAQLERYVNFRRHMKAGRFVLPLKMSIDATGRPGVRYHLQGLCARVPRLLTYTDDADIKVALTNDELKISFSGHYGAVLHSMRKVDDATTAKRALVGLAISLDDFGALNEAAELWTALPDLATEIKSVEIAARVLSILVRAGAYTELRSTLRALGSKFNTVELEMPLYALWFKAPAHRKRELTELLIELAEADLQQQPDAQGKSIASYTLGRLFEGINRKKARRHFVQAIRASSFYADKAYFWSELGASLFNNRRFSAAMRCYEHAYGQLGQTERRSRYGDALMHSGRYAEARRVFEAIANGTCQQSEDTEVHVDFAEAQIKAYALIHFKDVYGIDSQHRQTRAAQQFMGQEKNVPPDDMLSRCENAIRADALCNIAWFNRGIALYGQRRLEEALSSFMVAGATATSDDEAWLNALILALELKNRELLATLLLYLTHDRGMTFVRYMTENAHSRSDREQTMLMEISKMFVEQIPKSKEEALLRLHGPDGTEVIKGPVR